MDNLSKRETRLDIVTGVTMHVSISHGSATADGAYVAKLANWLAAAGVQVWYDREIVTGDRWVSTAQGKIDACAVFVVVRTPRARESSWVQSRDRTSRTYTLPDLAGRLQTELIRLGRYPLLVGDEVGYIPSNLKPPT
jgi:hypothetical protein